ncbi:PP2C family protein-serine/threonine phosphatase [Nocardia seriolae]|uniref:Protein-serine/threonine phosphatase n=1 Tax=Nocardia seriolae TaxID=37332 RepID=A0A0B8NS58_9NOCA|nr:protein phosphatase 2C domain-containing protein [Nocardia seriolae]APA96491.1 Protein-serine/threonine phosphatase [Nocardia seriolae]MTJ61559.1 serine/threonine protein phosphatase [Nocardia seriolae]MTJ76209.1 serine/threonine protein phosphatase [Nocardia seriolae]MTJ86580.1 serine/threonine protein phosphatase [Nocardia seriolae]MTK39525.1 serine/threonine protein phosphatase [Nocardia seriolae]
MHTEAIDIEPVTDREVRLGLVAGSAVSNVGRREINADAVATCTDSRTGRSAFVVADGVGDHLAAARAARLVARTAARVAVREGAHAGIVAAQRELLRELPDATADTVVVVAVLPAAGNPDAPCDIAWVGDCRVYRWNGRVLQCVTTDHTVAEYFRARGHDPLPGLAHLVTTSARTARPEDIGRASTGSSAGRLLLCTDGVGKRLGMPAIKSILAEGTSAKDAAEALVDAALASGGTDNTTALVVDAEPLR